jgi:hypothetical protein
MHESCSVDTEIRDEAGESPLLDGTRNDMGWNVEYTDEFGAWYETLEVALQDDIDRAVGILEAKGPH